MSSMCSDQERLEHPVSPARPAVPTTALPSSPRHPGSSVMIYGHFEGSLIEKQAHHGTGEEYTKGGRSRVTIDMLPDVALLEIFGFYLDEGRIEAWHTLVHVSQIWRNVVFGSPRRLNLRLCCTGRTPVRVLREKLDVWPTLPVVVEFRDSEALVNDDLIMALHAALEHNDRICDFDLDLTLVSDSELEKVGAAMQQPFPALTRLELRGSYVASAQPDSFLGGSAPRLRTLVVELHPFPRISRLVLSAPHLVRLELGITDPGYISPEAMVTCLSALTRLEILSICFVYRPHRKRQHPPPTGTLLPVLAVLKLKVACEYLEDFVARIDTPLLDKLTIDMFIQLSFDAPQLTQFISRSPKLKVHDEAHVVFSGWGGLVKLPPTFVIGWGTGSSPVLSSLVRVCSSSFLQTFILAVERLYIREIALSPTLEHVFDSNQWLEFFHLFTAVKDLFISQEFVPRVAPTLQGLVDEERVTEVLPALQNLFLEEPLPAVPVREAIDNFVAARQPTSHPITTFCWERERNKRTW